MSSRARSTSEKTVSPSSANLDECHDTVDCTHTENTEFSGSVGHTECDQRIPHINWPSLPTFRAHPLIRGGHLQTLFPIAFRQKCPPYNATRHHVQLADGDQIVLHDDCPDAWGPGDRVVLLVHGLSGCYMSGYMERLAHKLPQVGARAFRMDLRTCGAGQGLATLPYHAGITEDLHAVLAKIEQLCEGSPVALIGFSMSGNMVLKLVGEAPQDVPPTVDRAMAVNPPVDLNACAMRVKQGISRVYDRHWGRKLVRLYQAIPTGPDSWDRPVVGSKLAGIREFDDAVTAKIHGFGTVDNYYAAASANQFASNIRIPTLIISAADDPMIAREAIERANWSSAVRVHITNSGGHVGYIAGNSEDPDKRWIDWRVIDWVQASL